MTLVMQTLSLLNDAYRELRYRRLFWIALGLSLLAVLAIACTGLNAEGLQVLFWTIEFPGVSSSTISAADYYKGAFVTLGINVWLTWIATILALVTTAGMIPDLVASGSIDLLVSKPISRARLFLTKFAGGLLFSTLQVGVFTVASFFVIGLRGGAWEPGLFLAIPIVIVFYSYVFSFCALIGLVTRSTLASLLLTILMWGMLALLWIAFTSVSAFRVAGNIAISKIERDIASATEANATKRVAQYEEELAETKSSVATLDSICSWGELIVTVLPKTTATIEILEMKLISAANLPQQPDQPMRLPGIEQSRVTMREFTKGVEAWRARYSATWVIGTSLLFEAAVLGLCVLIFARRDY